MLFLLLTLLTLCRLTTAMPSYAKDLSGASVQSFDTRGNPYITTSKNMCIANLHAGICLISMFITPNKKHYDLYVFDPHCILVRSLSYSKLSQTQNFALLRESFLESTSTKL
jgi:hypothetical protein